MGIVERKQRQKEEVRQAILRAAWDLVESEGWQSLSIRRIADAIEYSSPVIYDHFQNKEAILQEFSRRGFSLLDEFLKKASGSVEDPAEQLRLMAFAYWDFAFTNRAYYQLMYGLGMPGCDEVNSITELQAFITTLKLSIDDLIARSGRTDIDAFMKLHTFWSTLHGLVSINILKAEVDSKFNGLILEDFVRGFVLGIR